MNNFINTAATDLARARTVGLNQLNVEPFPMLLVGTTPNLAWFFSNRGTIESFSGNANYTLKVTLGDAWKSAEAGNWSCQVGTESAQTLRWDLDAPGLQAVLDNSANVTNEGGVMVTEQLPGQFLIAHAAAGNASALTVSGALLVPDCTATAVRLVTGNATTRELVQLNLRRNPIVQQSTWSTVTSPANGWSGTIDLTNVNAYELLREGERQMGPFIEIDTLLTAEVFGSSNVAQCSYQTPVTLRALNYNKP